MVVIWTFELTRVLGNTSSSGEYRVKITTLIRQVLPINFSQPNFLDLQDPSMLTSTGNLDFK